MNVIAQIAAAVLNSFWQSVILTLLTALAIRLSQLRINAATRHIVWWIALSATILIPFVPHTAPAARPAPPAQSQTATAPLPAHIPAPFGPPTPAAPVTVPTQPIAVWPFWIAAIWGAVSTQRTVGILRSYIHLRRVKRRATVWTRPLPDLARPARLLLSHEISSPIAAGFLHSAVILPATLRDQLTPEEMHCVLLHECAHLARYDDWLNLIARLLGAIIVLHPVAWWILRQIEREREIACDDWVVAHTGAARSYAETLARIVYLPTTPADSVLATGIFTGHSRLHARIKMLLQHTPEFSTAAARIPVSAAALALIGLAIAGALAPHWIVFAEQLKFEVASVKPNTNDGPMDVVPRRSGDLVMMHNIQPHSIIYYAYHLHGSYQMVGYVRLPNGSNWFDIDARAGAGATEDQVRLMFQSLLEDRFKLKLHRETRDIPQYELVIAKGKSKLTPAREGPLTVTIEERPFTQRPGTCSDSMWREGAHMICHAADMPTIVAELTNSLRAPVVDHTGITGTFDLNLRYIPDDRKIEAGIEPGPSLTQAVQEELGLKLEKTKGPVEVIVIDHLEKPSQN